MTDDLQSSPFRFQFKSPETESQWQTYRLTRFLRINTTGIKVSVLIVVLFAIADFLLFVSPPEVFMARGSLFVSGVGVLLFLPKIKSVRTGDRFMAVVVAVVLLFSWHFVILAIDLELAQLFWVSNAALLTAGLMVLVELDFQIKIGLSALLLGEYIRSAYEPMGLTPDTLISSCIQLGLIYICLWASAWQAERNARLAFAGEKEVEHALSQLQQNQRRMLVQGRQAMVGELSAGLFHEIGNPLGFILNARDVLEEELENTPQQEPTSQLLKIMDNGIHRIEGILAQLRNLVGSEVENSQSTSLNEVIKRAIEMNTAQFESSHIEVMCELEAIPPIPANEHEVLQTLLILFQNSRDALGTAGGTLRIRSHCSNERAFVHIHDSGSGIDSSVRERIFDPFFTTKDQGQGTGLGLTIVAEVMKRHEGTVLLGEVSNGSEFILEFPAQSSSP